MPNRASVPIDGNRTHVPLTPAIAALAVTVDDSISTATDVTLNASTSFIEVNAVNGGVYMRYAATAAANAFDEYIHAGMCKDFYVPYGVTTVSFIQDQAGAGIRVIEKGN